MHLPPTGSALASLMALLLCMTPAPTMAQDGDKLETVMVTGSRVSYRDLLDTPAVSITRPGDYLLLPFTLINDTRSEQGRDDEIHATIRKMLANAGQRFELVHGDSFVTRIDAAHPKVPLDKDGKRPDTSRVSLFVRVAIGDAPERADELTRSLREFVAKAEKVGRTEIDPSNETALSLSRPERYRLDLIKAIADDTAKVREQLGQTCEVAIEGLSSRIEWQRVSASELMLYIPYTMKIEACGR